MLDPVRIESRLVNRIGVREWGLPSLVTPGQIWRSETHGTISCMTPNGSNSVHIETRKLEIIAPGEVSWMPDNWRSSLWEYVKAWPSSETTTFTISITSPAIISRESRRMARALPFSLNTIQ